MNDKDYPFFITCDSCGMKFGENMRIAGNNVYCRDCSAKPEIQGKRYEHLATQIANDIMSIRKEKAYVQ